MSRLKIALQKQGRLHHECIDLLLQCGLKIRIKERQLLCHCDNLPIDLLLVRDDDIPRLVADGICQLGIVGDNILREQPLGVTKVQALGFGLCRLSIAVPTDFDYTGSHTLNHRRIATSYPHSLRLFLNTHDISADIVLIHGSVEIATRLGIADAICDLVSTGSTLEENQLKEVETLFTSEAMLIQSTHSHSVEQQNTYALLLRRLRGVLQAQDSKYILFHAPKKALDLIKTLLPGCESPTILPLDHTDDKVAVHVVSHEGVFWDTLEKLKSAGASSILVIPIEKMLV